MPLVELLETTDVAALVLGRLDTTSMVALGRASRGVRAAQRSAIRDSPHLLVAAASNALALTKGQLVGWFALCDAEATTRKEAIALRAEFEPTLRALAEDAVESVRNAAKDELEDREW